MNWKPPDSEEKWQECLSAYIDDELAPDEKIALELYLLKNPARAEQLKEIRKLGSLLSHWEIDAPSPDEFFEDKILQKIQQENSRERDFAPPAAFPWDLKWIFQTAIFLLGVFVGGVLMNMIGKTGKTSSPVETHPQIQGKSVPAEKSSNIISDSQAEILLREISASQIKDKIMIELRKNNWEQASSLYISMREQYRDTQAWKNLENDKYLETVKKMPFSRRFINDIM